MNSTKKKFLLEFSSRINLTILTFTVHHLFSLSYQVVKKKRGRKRKVEEWTYKSSLHNKPVNDVVVKEKLLADMNLVSFLNN